MKPDIRILNASEVETLVGWAAAEGWNPGISDAQAFRAADKEGFLGAFVEGQMAAGIAAVAYDDAFGFIGLYICAPEARGKGLGRAVWDAGMAHLGSRTIGLDGVPAQQANYRSKGFRPAYSTLRYAGCAGLPIELLSGTVEVRPYHPSLRDGVAALDNTCFAVCREKFLDRWLQAPRQVLVAMRGGETVGYGVLRRCVVGCKIGPLFARDAEAAKTLFVSLAAAAEGEVSVDVPEEQRAFRHMLERQGMVPGFTTARMYLGEAPKLHPDWVFGVTTLELG